MGFNTAFYFVAVLSAVSGIQEAENKLTDGTVLSLFCLAHQLCYRVFSETSYAGLH